ncbi:TIGR03086 family metal-binding protein [Streptomyces sp. Ru87]|uniref:TIGR03086 family metal-binding protein n=1 Tax=Streptomyces sp. Ru87 TaxID=2044307 RepID=UPI000BF25859|nr:TIGR03086 family metal-binding protein [Streptomyces sp. Ru87]PGH48810.1 TIGR03086 family protein [Streptomyces sp. Ru87]
MTTDTPRETTPAPDLAPVAHQVALLLDGVEDDQYDLPTPCEEYAVRELLGHLLGLTVAFRDAARKDLGPTTDTAPDSAPPPPLTAGWRGRLRTRLDELAAAWREPSAWEGDTQAGGVTFPAAIAGRVALNELLLHGWDLARATGQDFTADAASLAVSAEIMAPPADPAERDGSGFGQVVEVPDDAPALDRAVALSGRDPSWTPPK